MKIGVNARFLKDPYTGIGRYTYFLFRELFRIDPESEYLLMTPEPCDFPNSCVLREASLFLAGFKKTYWEQIQIPQFLRKEKVSLVHFPYPSNPWYSYKVPTVLTIHDTIPWDLPEYRPRFLSKLYHAQTKEAAKKADKIITVSETSKKDILRHLKIREDKIEVIYNAASPIFSHKIHEAGRLEILKKHGILEKPYFLYVGGYDKRKNVSLLLEIFNRYIFPKYDVNLVLAGGKLYDSPLYGSFDHLTACGNRPKLKPEGGGAIRLGFLPDEELAAVYSSCLCFLHLSGKEGFNIPIVEAMESGAPIVLSDTEVHREIAKDGAEYVDLKDEHGIAGTLKKLIADSSYRRSLLERSKMMKGRYSWEKAAAQTSRLYRSI